MSRDGRSTILGGGVTGLAAARALGNAVVLEAEGRVGGLCRSRVKDGFTFDHAGHVLHFSQPAVQQQVLNLLGDNVRCHQRKATVWFNDRVTPYPFQVNLHGTDDRVARECVEGFREAQARRDDSRAATSFAGWLQATFGTGFVTHFFGPYNSKLWRVPLDSLCADWVDGMIPVPTLDEIQEGARGPSSPTLGYNAVFHYPHEGGMQALPLALASSLDVKLDSRVTAIDTTQRELTLQDNRRTGYQSVVSTMPLPDLCGMLTDVPPHVMHAADRLRGVSLLVFNMGISGSLETDAHWMYVPDPDIPFHRIGFPSNLSASLVPAGCSSLAVEVSYLPGARPDIDLLRERILDDLMAMGLISSRAAVVLVDVMDIENAYPVLDFTRGTSVATLRAYLASKGIASLGRGGAWDYLSIDECVRRANGLGGHSPLE